MTRPLAQQWAALNPRERLGVLAAGVALGVLLLVTVAIRPAWVTLRDGPKRLASLDTQLEAAQRAADEVRALRQVPAVPGAQAQAALKAATDFLGPQAQLTVQGDQVQVQLNEVPGEALLRWLGEARRAARARPVQAQLQRQGDRYSGTVVLAWSPAP